MSAPVVPQSVITEAVGLACRAPSLHNSQPWHWVDHGQSVDLFLDHHRIVRSSDSSGREAHISCGAALDHFRVAMAAAGWVIHVDRFPNPNNREHLAEIQFSPVAHVTDAMRDRASAISRRRTDRLPLHPPVHWDTVAPLVNAAIDHEAVRLVMLADDARGKLAEASQLTESLRRYDEFYHRELQWWTANVRQSDGVPANALVSSPEAERVGVNRVFPSGEHAERRPGVARDEARIAVLITPEDTPRDAIACGEALSEILLECTMAGLATCPLTHITEMPESRRIILELAGTTGIPQVLLRIGSAPPVDDVPPATPRRSLAEVLEVNR
ncbi:Acg family FMN-binding oxidoreductase [Mycolicibacterium goodii]|uniref:Acg family FMN-binding oxidoreductase n=1 Tax=Mycolicibacterium goodii TaxID=134601 RepID=UPI001BDCD935|nr:NAD(P)H nitroreductase [Mycolicibacterium goodii]MBU8831897.1 NAD(P)H nitroreductase [Mycolicibacterium goodii]